MSSPDQQPEDEVCTARQALKSTEPTKDYRSILLELKKDGHNRRADNAQPNLTEVPIWFDEALFENAKSVYRRHFMGVNFAHLSGLLLLVRVHSIYRTLSVTGKSDSVAKLFTRYYQTIIHVKKWYEGDIFEENSEAQRSLLIVRGMHNRVSSSLNDCNKNKIGAEATKESNSQLATNNDQQGGRQMVEQIEQSNNGRLLGSREPHTGSAEPGMMHLSEYDIMLTQFAFVGFIVTKAKHVGLIDDFNQQDLESFLHFWRVIGHYLGASERFNLCSRDLEHTAGLCEAIIELEYKKSISENPINSPGGIMSVNIVRSLKFIPMLTIYGIMKYLYELLAIETKEIESKSSRYSRLSYTLIKLVMSRLLAYGPFRSFNNGLTRLSLFLVGKVENWFTDRLEAKYGASMEF